jgi:hypothetical protein
MPKGPKPPRRSKGGRRGKKAVAGGFRLGGWIVEPGTRKLVPIRLGELYNAQPIGMRVWVLRGKRPGPRVWISGGIHGDELLGNVVTVRVLERIDPASIRGTLLVIPFVNEIGGLHLTRELPDGRDLNRCFPGSRTGTLASRIARAFFREVVRRCTHGIDLHTAGMHRDNLPQIRCNLDDPETRRMALAFGTRIVLHANLRDGSLRQAASARGVATLLFEGGQPLRHEPAAIDVATDGVLRVLHLLGVTGEGPPRARRPFVSWGSSWARAPRSGYFVPSVDLGDRVRAGELLGRLRMRGMAEDIGRVLDVKAQRGGLVVGIARLPLVHVGDPLVHVADLAPRARAEARPRDGIRDVQDA